MLNMTQLSSSQLRAARALLNWSRTDLAKRTGVSEPTLHRFENDQSEANQRTQSRIRSTLENAGIDFLENQGVRFRPEGLEILQGAEGIKKFLDQVYAYAQNTHALMRQNGIGDQLLFETAQTPAQEHKTRMETLKRARKNMLVRVLIQEGATDFHCPLYAEYKWFARAAPMPVPYYVFGDTVGIFAVEKNRSLKIYSITSPVIARTYVQQFDSAWKMANNPVKNR